MSIQVVLLSHKLHALLSENRGRGGEEERNLNWYKLNYVGQSSVLFCGLVYCPLWLILLLVFFICYVLRDSSLKSQICHNFIKFWKRKHYKFPWALKAIACFIIGFYLVLAENIKHYFRWVSEIKKYKIQIIKDIT